MKCKSCNEDIPKEAMCKLELSDATYSICMNCLTPFVCHALSKEQFKNLLRNGHGYTEFMLHSDFYDTDGTALQPYGE